MADFSVIYRSEHLRLVLYNSHSQKLAVVFDNRRVRNGDFPAHSHPPFFKGASLLHVQCKNNSWFLVPDLPRAIKVFAEISGELENVYLFGGSMGGYGALLFSGFTKVDAVLISSPQISIAPDKVPFERRFLKFQSNLSWEFDLVSEIVNEELYGFLLYDPLVTEDRRHKNLICNNYKSLEAIPVPFSGHAALSVFGESGVYGQLVKPLLCGTLEKANIISTRRDNRLNSKTYRNNLGSYLCTRKGRRSD